MGGIEDKQTNKADTIPWHMGLLSTRLLPCCLHTAAITSFSSPFHLHCSILLSDNLILLAEALTMKEAR